MDLHTGLISVGLEEDNVKSVAEKMDAYIKEIILFNSAYNLTNTSDYDELVIRHILDSLATYKIFEELVNNKENPIKIVGDIGSGGGLPGIPLATVFPEVQFKLVERMEKRCAFLENCAAILGLKNVEVVCSQAENITEDKFDLITFRAFRPLDKKMTKTLLRIVRKEGFLCAYKAKIDNISEEMEAIKSLIPEYKVLPLIVPGLEQNQRNLVLIQK